MKNVGVLVNREGNVVGTAIVPYLFAIILACMYAVVIVKSALSIYGDLRGDSNKVHIEVCNGILTRQTVFI